jgi:hypothetical protein
MRSSYIEVERLFPLGRKETTWENDPSVSHYRSKNGDSCQSLPNHVLCLVGNIPQLTFPADFDQAEPQDLIIAKDGLAFFDVGYHGWVVSTKDEEIIVPGVGFDNGAS